MRIHKEGYSTIVWMTVILSTLVLLLWWLIGISWLNGLLTTLAASLLLFLIRFFRDPKRPDMADDELIYSPADGLVVEAGENEENEYLKARCKKIAIFMSAWDVHVNWSPVSGTITFHRYEPGQHLLARHPKSSILNERSLIAIETPRKQEIFMKQIAGIMARRVVTRAKPGEQVQQGDEIGFIKLGSRVEVFVPLDTELLVRPGQPVSGKITPIARWMK